VRFQSRWYSHNSWSQLIGCSYALDHQQDIAGLICESFAYEVPAPDFALAVIKGLSQTS
jgi:hypothetical protein